MFRRPSLNRPGPRLGTFLGELALIVVGVLLALSVDEWRQARARTVAGEQAVVAIRAEIVSNRELAIESRDYHLGRVGRITESFRSGDPLARQDFPRGFISPARFLSAAWETARESGELGAVDRDLRREIAEAYKGQSRYEVQAENMSALIYRELYESAGREGVGNPGGLMMLIGAFRYREDELIVAFDETLAVIDAR